MRLSQVRGLVRPALRAIGVGAVQERPNYSALMPANPLNTDLYLVAFPKSGITWLSFMLANVNLALSGRYDRQRATFFNINDLIPDIHVSRDLRMPRRELPGFRMIKSHSSYNPHYKKIVLLVRNPVHVLSSYYDYLVGLKLFDGSVEQLVSDPIFGVSAWASHTMGWLNKLQPEVCVCLVKYEELRSDARSVLQQLYDLFGLEVEPSVISSAIERSGFNAMRAEEKKYVTRYPINVGVLFVRETDNGGPKVPMSEYIRKEIRRVAGPVLDLLGYE